MTSRTKLIIWSKKIDGIMSHPNNSSIHVPALEKTLNFFMQRLKEIGISEEEINREYQRAIKKINRLKISDICFI